MPELHTLESMAAHLEVMSTQIAVLSHHVRAQMERSRRPGPLAVIVETVALEAGLSVDQLKGRQRHRPLTDARTIAIYLSTQLTGFSQTRIGYFFDRDHTTVHHAIKRVGDWQAARDIRAARLAALRVALEAKLAELKEFD